MNRLIVFVFAVCIVVGCRQKEVPVEKVDFLVKNDTIAVSGDSPILNKLENRKVRLSSYNYELSTSGIVQAIPNNYALVPAPFSGRVTKSYVRLGQEVKANAPIFEISSPSYFETGKAYYQSKAELDLALKNLKRQQDLYSKGVGAQKEMEEAEVNYALKKKDYENALASLKVFRVDDSSLVLGEPMVVRSPIKGTIVKDNIVIGQYLREDSDPVVTVAKLSSIWVAAQVKEKDIRFIDPESEVKIKLIAYPEKNLTGKIYHISSLIDEETRSVEVLISCDNSDRIIRPGMYVTATFSHKIDGVVVVPSQAVFQKDDNSYVFLHTRKNEYLKKKIGIVAENTDSTVVKEGLEGEDEILVNGGFYLLSKN
jgi:membrane fusion protein, heavy metal efflux system